jgi:hypothetical protein
MSKQQGLVIVATLAVVGKLLGCSSPRGALSTGEAGEGGVVNGSGGAALGMGGGTTGGAGGIPPGSGGTNATGGAITATGGVQYGTGGAVGTGGKTTGGTSSATGGTPSNGGTSSATGGTPSSGGTSSATGGTPSTGGTSSATGGTPSTGGTSSATGGTPSTGGAGTGGTITVDPTVGAAINACIDKLPYGGRDMSADKRAPIVSAIVSTCAEFAPPGAQWQTHCQMFLVAAINAESSYDTRAGTQGAGTDPSVGLLQIRFSSVVRDFADYGPVAAMARIGCDFGTVTSSDSYATKGAMMLDVNCNIAIGAWYYFIFASGNGGSNVVWVDQYCAGRGVAGNLHIGMASFLMGGDAAHSSLSGADFYYNEIKSWFDPCVTYTGTHPFELSIQPDTDKYCR